MQLLGQHFIAVPRFVWCFLLSLVTFALAYGGRNVLEEILTNLLATLGYWTLAFAEILFLDHFLFRPRLGGYNLSQTITTRPCGVCFVTHRHWLLLLGNGSNLGQCRLLFARTS